jgi:hypothetical protein
MSTLDGKSNISLVGPEGVQLVMLYCCIVVIVVLLLLLLYCCIIAFDCFIVL